MKTQEQMKMLPQRNAGQRIACLLLIAVSLFCLYIGVARAVPEGASVVYVSNSTKNITQPAARTDSKGTITTILVNTIQQNLRWKAYVGNVSATLVLRDAQDFSIYEWTALGSPDGEIYISRNSSVDWSTISCANTTHINNEETMLNITDSLSDSITNTFSDVAHKGFWVGATEITASRCPSTATWVNNTAQAVTDSSLFQEVLLSDGKSLIYVAPLERDVQGYRNQTTYDFQAILPDSGLPTGGPYTYYFYIEVS